MNTANSLKFSSIIHCQAQHLLQALKLVLKDIVLGDVSVDEITPEFAFELLSRRKAVLQSKYC